MTSLSMKIDLFRDDCLRRFRRLTALGGRASIGSMNDERRGMVGISKKAVEAAVTLLKERIPGLLGVWLFGSALEGEMRPDSDVDIAILAEAPLDAWMRLQLAAELSRLFGRDVDLVDLRRSATVMRMQVVARGRRVFCLDAPRCEAFEDFVFSDYARLNEERAGILADVAARGSIHG